MITMVKVFLSLVVAAIALQQLVLYWDIVWKGTSIYNWPMANVIFVGFLWPFLVLLVAYFAIQFIMKFDPKEL